MNIVGSKCNLAKEALSPILQTEKLRLGSGETGTEVLVILITKPVLVPRCSLPPCTCCLFPSLVAAQRRQKIV